MKIAATHLSKPTASFESGVKVGLNPCVSYVNSQILEVRELARYKLKSSQKSM